MAVAASRGCSSGLRQLRWDLIIAALALFCCTPLSADTPRIPGTPSVHELKSDEPAVLAAAADSAKPDAPSAKASMASRAGLDLGSNGNAIEPGNSAILSTPVKPAATESFETPRQRKIWYGLLAVNHSAAAFDAWTTRQAISGGYGVESDPLQRPFAHSGALYATTQVTPLLTDFLGHRMMRSRYSLIRRAWWVPQVASASVSFGAGLHNYTVVH